LYQESNASFAKPNSEKHHASNRSQLGSARLLFNLADLGGVGSCAKPLVLGWTSYATINMGTGSGARLETKAFLW